MLVGLGRSLPAVGPPAAACPLVVPPCPCPCLCPCRGGLPEEACLAAPPCSEADHLAETQAACPVIERGEQFCAREPNGGLGGGESNGKGVNKRELEMRVPG